MDNLVKTPDDDNGRNVGMSPIYYISTVEHSRDGANDDKVSSVHHQPNNSLNVNQFVPSINPIKRCPSELGKSIYNSLTETEKKILHYYKEFTPQIEVAQKLGISIASHGRNLKMAKIKLGIRTKKVREAIAIMHVAYGYHLSEKVLSDVSFWATNNYGRDSEIANKLREELLAMWKKSAEENRKLRALQKQQNNGTTN